jgi:hypothetical protein
MEKLDLRKQYKHLYAPSPKKVEVVDVPAFKFVMIDGQIEEGRGPGTSPGFQEAVQALYSASYTLKFMSKQREVDPIDYGVMALEGLWWFENGEFDITKPDNWFYTLLIMQPEHIDEAMFQEARRQLERKRPSPALSGLRLAAFHEGLSVQTLHVGPYATEPETVARMNAYAADHGYRMAGVHHEIYLGDPLRSAPDKLKTILRHAIVPEHSEPGA